MKKQKAKFFCENCGEEVPQNARFCKKCGKFFSSVRCPNCGTTGPASAFNNGCPNCGYAVNSFGLFVPPPENKKEKKYLSFSSRKKIKTAFSSYGRKTGTVSTNDSSLPVWIYGLTAAALAGILAALYSCMK